MSLIENISFPGAQMKLSIASFASDRADDLALSRLHSLGIHYGLHRIARRLAYQVVAQTEHFIPQQQATPLSRQHSWQQVRGEALQLVQDLNHM